MSSTSELEKILLNSYKEDMVSFLNSHPEYFEEAIDLAISDEERLSWRSAWLLWSCIEKDDPKIRKHIDRIINAIPEKKDGHQRELVKILSVMKLNEEQEGRLFDICMNLWEGLGKSPSIRYTAINFIFGMTKKYPELKSELEFLLQDQYLESLSPGVKRSIEKMRRQLK